MACILMLLIFNVKLLKMADTYGTFMILFIFPSYRFHRQSVQTSVWSDHYFLFRFSLSSFYSPDSKVQGPTRGPSGADRTQVGPMLAPWPCHLGVSRASEQTSGRSDIGLCDSWLFVVTSAADDGYKLCFVSSVAHIIIWVCSRGQWYF